MKDLERQYKALANGKRLTILKFLKGRHQASVGEIAKEIKLSFHATSKHLGILSTVDALEKTKQSLQVFYRLAEKPKPAIKHFLNLID